MNINKNSFFLQIPFKQATVLKKPIEQTLPAESVINQVEKPLAAGWFSKKENPYSKGYKDGIMAGFNKGFQDGYQKGMEEGFIKGHEIGYEEGQANTPSRFMTSDQIV